MSNETTIAMAYVAFLVLVLALLAIWSRRQDAWPARHGSMFLCVLSLLALAYIPPSTLGRPLPIRWEIRTFAQMKVTGVWFIEGEAIFILVDVGLPIPRTYSLPWDDATAQQLSEAMRKAYEDTGKAGAIAKWNADKNDVEVPMQFWPMPQPASPPKQADPEGPFYNPQ